MKKIETPQSVAAMLKNLFATDFPGVEFPEEAVLISCKEIKEGPAWLLKLEAGYLILEVVTRYAYFFGGTLSFSEEIPDSKKTFSDSKKVRGKVSKRGGQKVVIWG